MRLTFLQKISPVSQRLQITLLTVGITISAPAQAENPQPKKKVRPQNFVVVDRYIPGIKVLLTYSTTSNFTGKVVTGYNNGECWITKEAADALSQVQKEAAQMGLALLVFDAFRPQRAVDSFVEWAKESDTSKHEKEHYFPNLDKSELFPKGYIADKSGHTRGSTIDLTLCELNEHGEPLPLDMGTPFDFFGEEAGTKFKGIPAQQRANRLLLKTLMEKHGFKNYPVEWWHFTLKNEPYPNSYFNFPISAKEASADSKSQ
jgi:D-alanyl-D-alanine dipeptidase